MKSRKIAALLNIIPGAGYVYIGGKKRTFGLLLLFAITVTVIGAFDPRFMTDEYLNAPFTIWDGLALVSIALGMTAFIYDAYHSIDNITTSPVESRQVLVVRQFINKYKHTLTISVSLGVIFIGLLVYVVATDTVFKRFKNIVLTDASLVQDADVISQETQLAGLDELSHLHIQIPVSQAQRMVSINSMKECVKSRENCTNPIWQPYRTFHSSHQESDGTVVSESEFGVPTIDGANDERNVVCTSAWSPYTTFKHAASGICVDRVTGDVWYELNII
ncbi:MAG: hypothetical protein ABIR91_06010 [Candidatus Saccharimonadales bacterium]